MIARLTGKLAAKSPAEIVVDVGGVAFALSIPLSTFDRLADVGSQVSVHTHLHVREDALQLYGFASAEERELFELLLGVSGIGPKVALAIVYLAGPLSGSTTGTLLAVDGGMAGLRVG